MFVNHVQTTKREARHFLETLNDFFASHDADAIPAGYTMLSEVVLPMERLIQWRVRETENRRAVLVNNSTGEKWMLMVSYQKNGGDLTFHQIDALYKLKKNRFF